MSDNVIEGGVFVRCGGCGNESPINEFAHHTGRQRARCIMCLVRMIEQHEYLTAQIAFDKAGENDEQSNDQSAAKPAPPRRRASGASSEGTQPSA